MEGLDNVNIRMGVFREQLEIKEAACEKAESNLRLMVGLVIHARRKPNVKDNPRMLHLISMIEIGIVM